MTFWGAFSPSVNTALEMGDEAAAGALSATSSFSDGSSVQVTDGRLEVLDNSGERFVTLLRGGTARFEVTPGGPRRWIVRAGPARVEVVGTVFEVSRSESETVVRVERGAVLVHADALVDGVRRLHAGESVRVAVPREIPPIREGDAEGARAEPTPATGPASEPEPEAETEAAVPVQQAPTPSFDQVMERVDSARMAGNHGDAASLLRRTLEGPLRPRDASIVHFTLGRIYADSLGRPREGAERFRAALEAGLPVVLREDAFVRGIEAQRLSGDLVGAHRLLDEYLEAYTDGRRHDDALRAAGQAPPNQP